MGRSMPMKRTKKQLLPSITSLPEELLIEVLAHVGSSSVNDLFNLKQSCKAFYKVGDDAEVLRRVSIEKLPAVPWWDSPNYFSFVRQCEEKSNPEALFKHGMVEYFSSKKHMKQEVGIGLLTKAACLGHEEAAYILGLIMLCTNHGLKAQAFNFLRNVEKGSTSTTIKKCRKRVKEIIGQMWIRSGSLPQPEPMCTSLVCNRNGFKSQWLSIEDEEPSNCEACRWDREIVLIRSILNV